VNDVPVTSAKAAMKMLKSCADKIAAQLVLRRLPAGYVCLLRRTDNHFESLGLRTVGGTAEVSRSILAFVVCYDINQSSFIETNSQRLNKVIQSKERKNKHKKQ